MDYHIRTLEQLRPILVGLRKQAGLSQTAVASLLGVSQQSYAKIEANPTATSVERIFKILSLLGAEIIVAEKTGAHAHPIPAGVGPVKEAGKKPSPSPKKLIPASKKLENW